MARLPIPNWSQLTAIYGGTFDPPHLGHREAVFGLFENPGVRQVILLPSGLPPLKGAKSSAEHRLEMARLGFGPSLGDRVPGPITIDDYEIERAALTGGTSYTFDTLLEFRRRLPGGQLAFVLGIDQLAQLPRWSRFPEILTLCHWIVLARRPGGLESGRAALGQLAAGGILRAETALDPGGRLWATPGGTAVQLVETPARALSSTTIRETLEKTGKCPNDSLLPSVESYLKTHRLYGTQGHA